MACTVGFDSRQGQDIFVSSTVSNPALVPTETPIQWVPANLPPLLMPPEREADNSIPSSLEVKNGVAMPPLPHVTPWCGA
jgi:hypothetical protein